jgi:phosphoribosylformimino-5-aminoimidazole carboxamide ribotide isomerase
MIIIPAIDIRGGRCVRLLQGDYDRETVYGADPVEMALRWQSLGAERLHVVDLDGARDGAGVNREVIARIAGSLTIPVQTGGGMRDEASIRWMLEHGVERCVVGTTAALEEDTARSLFERFGDSLILGLDARDGKVAVQGWRQTLDIKAVDLAVRLVDAGARRIIYTDIARDGMQTGANISGLQALAQAADVPVIASGGIGSLEDIISLRSLERWGVEGVITGKALYEGTLSLPEAIAAAA